jgi:hypothetical protein
MAINRRSLPTDRRWLGSFSGTAAVLWNAVNIDALARIGGVAFQPRYCLRSS